MKRVELESLAAVYTILFRNKCRRVSLKEILNFSKYEKIKDRLFENEITCPFCA